jgi:Tol biopolymer transport system component/DNA-binding winged helix-turn-helix (wHTH) protein
MEQAAAMIYQFEDVVLDAKRLIVKRDGRVVDLEPKALRVLLHLVEHRDRVVSKDELIAEIWHGTFVTDNAVTRVIAQIRKQLGDRARSPRLIETATTAGYRFIAEVTESGDPSVDIEVPRASAFPARLPVRWAAAILVLAACTSLAWWKQRTPSVLGAPFQRIEQITSSAAADLWPSFSPDGSELAFSSNRTGHFEIFTRSLADGGAERQITFDGQDNIQPAWSPDGRYLAFVAKVRGGIGLIPASGGPIRYLTSSGSDPHWSPDGKTLVYRSTNLNTVREAGSWNSFLLLVDRDGSAPHELTHAGSPRGGHNHPRWLPDGRHVVFAAPGKLAAQTLWVVDVGTGAFEQLGTGASDKLRQIEMNFIAYPAFTKDASYMYFVGSGRREPMGLWRARVGRDWTAQTAEPLGAAMVTWPRDLALTNDGAHLAFSQETVKSAIWSIPINGAGAPAGEPKAITQGHSFRDSSPEFSPDGSRLAYTSSRHGGNTMVYVCNADGSSTAPISPADQNSFDPAWSGKELMYGSHAPTTHGSFYWLSSLSGPPKELNLKLDVARSSRLRISPDGTRIVAHIGSPDNYQLVVEDLNQGTVHQVTPAGRSIGFPVWSPDGRWIAAQERIQGSTRLVILPAEGGEIRTLVSDPVESWANSWSQDGDRIAFAGLRNGVWNIYWVSRSTGRVQQLTHLSSQSAFVRYPTWSPGNDQVAFEYNELEANIYVGDLR